MLPLIASALVMVMPAVADAATVTERYGPVSLSPYEVEVGEEVFNIPTPGVDGFITHMKATLTYADGSEVPIANTMLHHVVMANLGSHIGDKQDATCNAFRRFDSQTFLPLAGERFYGLGEERHELRLPRGYGYPIAADDKWAMTYMLMNHRPVSEDVFITYRMRVETQPLKPVRPVWMDVRDCSLDPIYDVPGGARRGATHTETKTWTAPEAGRVVFATGHLHGGGRRLELSKPDCGDRPFFTSRPLWGRPDHPYYNVRPLLHEPGPIAMSNLETAQGIPVAEGERIELKSVYDAHRPHARVMGIVLVGFAPDASVTEPCAGLPNDRRTFFLRREGRRNAPKVTVPITSWPGGNRRARVIRRAPGATVALRGDGDVDVKGYRFSPANLEVRRGHRVRWRFLDSDLHNVSFASGPRAFSSDNLDDGRTFQQRLTTPGTYRLFCTLHPVTMASTVRVR